MLDCIDFSTFYICSNLIIKCVKMQILTTYLEHNILLRHESLQKSSCFFPNLFKEKTWISTCLLCFVGIGSHLRQGKYYDSCLLPPPISCQDSKLQLFHRRAMTSRLFMTTKKPTLIRQNITHLT